MVEKSSDETLMVNNSMARTSIFSERVQNLVNNKLLPLLFAERSTAQLCKLLNKRLSELGTNGTIHPNRIHTLLSDDISRGINDATLDLIERAADACWASNGGWRDRSDKRLTELKAEAENRRDLRDMNDLQIARHMGIPPAMVRYLLASGSPIPQQISTPDFPKVLARPATPPVKNPDWSFQDIAISRTLEAFRQRPTSKIGLILPTGSWQDPHCSSHCPEETRSG